jgi:5'-nucleotidase
MKLLVTNDDGVASPGLWSLADGLRDGGHEVVVVAPAGERSGSGAAVGAIIPGETVAVSPVERDDWQTAGWAVDAPPALCVLLALRTNAFGEGFEAVVSGINPGWNTGRGVIHSGTVGAVLTGGASGLPGVAVSLDAHTAQVGEVGLLPGVREHWATAASLAVAAVAWLDGLPRPAPSATPTMVNLNVPNRPLGEVRGVRPASLGRMAAEVGRTHTHVGDDGRLRLDLDPPPAAHVPGSDNDLLLQGWATVTLLTGIGDAGAEEAEAPAQRLDALVRQAPRP